MLVTSKLVHEILHKSDTFCCLCLNPARVDLVNINDEVTLDNEQESEITFSELLDFLFGKEVAGIYLLSNALCETCAKSAIKCYMFIKQCKETSQRVNRIIDSFTSCADTMENFVHSTVYIALDPTTQSTALIVDSKVVKDKISASKRFLRSVVKDNTLTEILPTFAEYLKKNHLCCEKCNQFFTTKSSLNRHMTKGCQVIEKMKIEDNFDESTFDDDTPLVSVSGPSYLCCEKCGTRCCNRYILRRHKTYSCKFNLLRKEKKQPVRREPSQCTECGEIFASKQALGAHQLKHEFIICSECGKSVRANRIQIHELSHTRKLKCHRCGKVYKHIGSFQEHMKYNLDCDKKVERDPVPKNFICDFCSKRFGRKTSLGVHIRLVHNDSEPKLECMWCKKKFLQPSALKCHILKHTQEKKFECNICGGKYVTRESLLYHTRLHTGEKPFKCKSCDKTFASASRRADHMRSVHLPPSLECKLCYKKFRRHGALSRHKRRHYNPKSSLYYSGLEDEMNTKK